MDFSGRHYEDRNEPYQVSNKIIAQILGNLYWENIFYMGVY